VPDLPLEFLKVGTSDWWYDRVGMYLAITMLVCCSGCLNYHCLQKKGNAVISLLVNSKN
jgi:hypothetical protein